MTLGRIRRFRSQFKCLAWALSLGAITSSAIFVAAGRDGLLSHGRLELDTKSDYSHIRIYRKQNVRTMVFVRDSGEEALESQVDLQRPHELHFTYLQYMFASYLFRPQQHKVLIVGLGGGSMVHFLRHYDPKIRIDAVEIDPVVASIAEKYFGIRSGGAVNVVTEDGVKYLEDTHSRYDVIYMDAFLKPSSGTDDTGAPLQLRTLRFYENVRKRLEPGGLVVFNINPHPKVDDDLASIEKGFRQAYVFRLPRRQGLVVVASMAHERAERSALRRNAEQLDRRFGASFSFRPMADNLDR